MIESSSVKGYILKEAGTEKRQLSYVDDHTVTAKSPEDAQHILSTLDSCLLWTACMRAKSPKCRSLSFKILKKGADDRFTPSSETRYSAFDLQLSVSGKIFLS